jgi:hypothetical protein
MDIAIPFETRARELQAFTHRNMARRTRVEIDDPLIGALSQEVDLPLLGVAYDPRDQRVEVIVGDPGGPRLTHSIAHVTGIDLLREGERDRTLRVSHGDAQTLL